MIIPRSSRPEVFCKKGVLRNFTKFTGKHLCQSPFLIKLQASGLKLLKKRLWHTCFPVNFAKFLRTPFRTEHLRWLLLQMVLGVRKSICKSERDHVHQGLKWEILKFSTTTTSTARVTSILTILVLRCGCVEARTDRDGNLYKSHITLTLAEKQEEN